MINPAIEIDLEYLHLDNSNPRFGLFNAGDEQEALTLLVDTANVKELWGSIAARGFERFEPLIAIKDSRRDGHFIVIEGNRRLAACQSLANPELLGARAGRVPKISAEVADSIKELPVIVVGHRSEADAYIGFKHVNGPSTWTSLAKARFGVQLLEDASDVRPRKERMQELTQKLGDSRGMLLRVFVAFKIYEQAISGGIIEHHGIDTEKLQFSHLYTMLNHPPTRDFLGLPAGALSEDSVIANPVPDSHCENLEQLFGWLFGPNSVIRSQGSDRPKLQKVIASATGLEALRASSDLAYSYAIAGLGKEDWHDRLHQCAALAKQIDGDTLEVLENMETEERKSAQISLARSIQYLQSAVNKISQSRV
jgi:ParB-like nuclease domain